MCRGNLIKYGAKYLHRKSLREITVEKVQRFRCTSCLKIFTNRKSKTRRHFTSVFIQEAVKDFIQGRSSYAVIKERKRVSLGTLSSWVHQYGFSCMNPQEIAVAFRFRTSNRWSSILILDAKYLNRRMVLLLAIDYGTLDIVAWIVCEAETEENYGKLITMIKECGYGIEAFVSDGEPGIIALTQPKKPHYFVKGTKPRPGHHLRIQTFPSLWNVPHQWCVVHAERELKHYLVKFSPEERKVIEELIHRTLFASTIGKAEKWRGKLLEEVYYHPRLHRVFAVFLSSRWDMLTAHFTVRVSGRKIPRSSNAIENVISYVNTRLKTIRRIRNLKSAEAICNLIVVNFRTKPFINTKNKLKREKSPLELALGKKKKFDWMEFIKKPTP